MHMMVISVGQTNHLLVPQTIFSEDANILLGNSCQYCSIITAYDGVFLQNFLDTTPLIVIKRSELQL